MLEGLTPPANKAIYCKVAQTMEGLEESDAKILQAALDDTARWKNKTLANALRAKGLSLADTTIAKHRTKTCACYRS